MKIALFLAIPIALLVAFNGCNHSSDSPELVTADSLMFVNPQQSLHILENINPEDLDKQNRPYYAMLLSQARTRNYIPIVNDSLIKIALNYYETEDNSQHKAWAYVVAGYIYDHMGQDSLCIHYLKEAMPISESSDNIQLKIMNNFLLGQHLTNIFPYEACIPYLDKTINCATAISDTAHIILSLSHIGHTNMRINKYDEAKSAYFKALPYTFSHKFESYRSIINYKLALLNYESEDFKGALHYINEAQNELYLKGVYPHVVYALKANILAGLEEWDSIPHYAKLSLIDSTYIRKSIYYTSMYKWAIGKGDYRQACRFSVLHEEMNDSIHAEKMRNKTIELEKKYSLLEAQKILNESKEKQLLMVIISLLIFMCLICVSLTARYFYKRNRRLTHEVSTTNDKLMQVNERRRQDEYKHMTANVKKATQMLSHDEVINKLHSTKSLNSIRDHSAKLTETEFASIYKSVNEIYDDFLNYARVTYLLSKNDVQLVALMLLDIESSKLRSLLDLEPDTLKKRKHRLKKEKFKCSDSSDTWLIKIATDYLIEKEMAKAKKEAR